MKSLHGYTLTIKILSLMQVMSSVEANYTLEVLMVGYQNPLHMALELINVRHGCCNSDRELPCEPCENAFRVCVREMITEVVSGECGLLNLESKEIPDDDDDIVFTDDIGGLSNPIIVSGDVWQVHGKGSGVCVCVHVWLGGI